MPYYVFENIETGKTEDVFFHMNDSNKVYNGESGKEIGKWKRVYLAPLSAVDTKMDPYNPNDFVKTTSNKRGMTVGKMWEKSAEASEQRAGREGKDPIKEAFFDKYKKETGLKHHVKIKEEAGVKAKEFVRSLGLRT